MTISRVELIDKLTRAFEMEEEMTEELIDKCFPSEPFEEHAELAEMLRTAMKSMKKDSLRHKKIVGAILSGLRKANE
jgi:hypothetical protein